MGGYGSGKRYDARIRVEECLTFPTSWLLQNSYFALSVGQTRYFSLTWSEDRNNSVYLLTGNIALFAPCQMRLYLGSTGQVVYLHATVAPSSSRECVS
jgi:hypothetical protein